MTALRRRLRDLACRAGNLLIGPARVTGPPILVTGNGRSGTSWIAGTLARAEGLLYYREPCHPEINGLPPEAAHAVWAAHVPPGGRHPFLEQRLDAAFRGHFWPGSRHRLTELPARLRRRPRILVKEVAAFMSVEWAAARWGPEVLVVLRHPAACAASVRALGQDAAELARLRLLRSLPAVARAPFAPCLDRIADPLEATASAWAIRTATVLEAVARHPDWAVVRYEELAADPVAGFRRLYARFGLAWTPALAAEIAERSRRDEGGAYSTRRDAAARIHAWRDRLSAAEIARLRRLVAGFGLPVYAGEADWPRTAVPE